MSLPKALALGAFAVAIVATTGWFVATRKDETAGEPFAPPATTVRADAIAPSLATSVAVQQDSPASKPFAQRSTEERTAAVKHTLAAFLVSERDGVTETLVRQGLSQEDAERMGERAFEGYVNCLFDTAREQYEARGASVDEFLDRAERGWSRGLDGDDANRVRWTFARCRAVVSQQTGLSLPADYTSVGSSDGPITPPPPPPPWAPEIESRIRDHIASRPGFGVTDVLVDCRQAGCNVMLVGRDIRIFEFDFDVFAEQNGFARAVLSGESNRRLVWLER